MKKSLACITLSFFALTTANVQAQTALRGGLVENADVFLYVDMAKMNQSAFTKTVEDQQSAEEKALTDEKTAKFTAATGLKKEDVKALAFSMDIDNIDFQSQDPAQLDDAQAVVAVELAKPITLEQAKAGIESMSKDGESKATLTIGNVEGLDVITLESTSEDKGPDKAFGTLSPDRKTLLMAFNIVSLKDSLARIASGNTAAPTEDMAAAMKVMGDRHLRMALVLPPVARQKIQEGVKAAAAQGGMAAMMAPFGTAKSLQISASTTDSLDFFLSLDLANAGNAQQAAGMVQSMLPMMMMSMGPQAMELSQKIKISPDDTVVAMTVNMTPADIKKITDASQNKSPVPADNGMGQ